MRKTENQNNPVKDIKELRKLYSGLIQAHIQKSQEKQLISPRIIKTSKYKAKKSQNNNVKENEFKIKLKTEHKSFLNWENNSISGKGVEFLSPQYKLSLQKTPSQSTSQIFKSSKQTNSQHQLQENYFQFNQPLPYNNTSFSEWQSQRNILSPKMSELSPLIKGKHKNAVENTQINQNSNSQRKLFLDTNFQVRRSGVDMYGKIQNYVPCYSKFENEQLQVEQIKENKSPTQKIVNCQKFKNITNQNKIEKKKKISLLDGIEKISNFQSFKFRIQKKKEETEKERLNNESNHFQLHRPISQQAECFSPLSSFKNMNYSQVNASPNVHSPGLKINSRRTLSDLYQFNSALNLQKTTSNCVKKDGENEIRRSLQYNPHDVDNKHKINISEQKLKDFWQKWYRHKSDQQL